MENIKNFNNNIVPLDWIIVITTIFKCKLWLILDILIVKLNILIINIFII